MAFYEFECKKCGAYYEELTSFDETGKYKGVKCPACNSSRKTKLVSMGNFNFSNPVGTDRWTSDGQGHDYRFRYVQPKLKKDRETAEKLSHVGKNPYRNIDDISHGKHFGDVK
jgi:putative FmdB family regulatory protein